MEQLVLKMSGLELLSPPLPLVKGDVWFDDGNVTIQTEQIQFRVHKSILSLYSLALQDMIDQVPPTSGECVSYAQTTTVPFSAKEHCFLYLKDSPKDLVHLLAAIYEHPNSGDPTDLPTPMPLPVLSALLRLGTKYSVGHIRDNALARLRAQYPSSIDQVHVNEENICYIVEHETLHSEIAMLVKDTGVLSSLPYSLYMTVVHFTLESIFDGVPGEGGEKVILPFEMQRSCIIGKENLLEAMSVAHSWLSDVTVHQSCSHLPGCSATFRSMGERIFMVPQDPRAAFMTWEKRFSDINQDFVDLCDSCEEMAKGLYGEGIRWLWGTLPSLFGLPPWEDLCLEESITYKPIELPSEQMY